METVTQGGPCHFVCLHVWIITWHESDQIFNQTNNNDNNNNNNNNNNKNKKKTRK